MWKLSTYLVPVNVQGLSSHDKIVQMAMQKP